MAAFAKNAAKVILLCQIDSEMLMQGLCCKLIPNLPKGQEPCALERQNALLHEKMFPCERAFHPSCIAQEKIEPGLLLAGKKIAPFEAVSEAGAFEYPVQVP